MFCRAGALRGEAARGDVLAIETDLGIAGEFVGGVEMSQLAIVGRYLLGKNPLERELVYNDLKRALRKNDRLVMGPIDVALWDIAGKLRGAPVYELLGGYRGRPQGDVAALVDAILAIGRYAEAHRDTLAELDVNPVVVRPRGAGAVAVDVLIRKVEEP